MAYTAAELRAIPLADFADPKNRKYPIKVKADVADAWNLAGHADNPDAVRARIKRIAARKGWEDALPDTAQVTMSDPDAYAVGPITAEESEVVIRTGVIFRAGDYPDKAFALSAAELDAAAEAFAPVKNRVQHLDEARVPTIFDNNLGQLRSVAVDDDGLTLLGEIAIPRWLDEYQRTWRSDKPLATSLEWDRATKRIVGNTLVPNPRISDSDLVSAYAAFAGKRHSAADQELIQRGHGLAERVKQVFVGLGAAPDGSPAEEAAETPAQEAAEQAAGMAGAQRAGTGVGVGSAPFTKEQGMTDTVAQQTADKPRSLGDKFWAWFTGSDLNDTERAEVQATFARTAPPAAPKVAPDAEKDALKARIAAMEQERIAEKAAAFADTMIAEKRALPAEREAMIAAFTQAANDDAAHPAPVTFADGAERTRLDLVKAGYTTRTPHLLTEEVLKDPQFAAVFNRVTTPAKTEQELTEERRAELLKKTNLGRATLTGK